MQANPIEAKDLIFNNFMWHNQRNLKGFCFLYDYEMCS